MTESLDTVSVENQLAVLREIVSLLRRARIPYWVRGGWAVDFLIGRARPRHEDIDLVTWSRHAARLRRLLEDVSYQLAPTPQPVRQYDFVKNGVDVSFVFIRRDADGVIRSPGSPEWRWPDDALAHAPCTLMGIRARPLPAHLLLAEKLGYEKAMGRPFRTKDHESIRLLREIVGDDL